MAPLAPTAGGEALRYMVRKEGDKRDGDCDCRLMFTDQQDAVDLARTLSKSRGENYEVCKIVPVMLFRAPGG